MTATEPLATVSPPETAVAPITRIDVIWSFIGFFFAVTVSLVLGRNRIFWEDEMLGWMLLTDPSWHHMIRAWKLGADGGGFSFYATGRLWLDLFGASAIAFRMYSAVCFGLAFVLNWFTARRFYGLWIVGIALFNTYFCSPPIVLHLAEGRFYGLLMLSTALALWIAAKLEDFPDRVPPMYLLLVLLGHALLTTSHLLGVVYSGFIVLGMAVLDRLRSRFRPLVYLSAALTWLLLIPEREALHASAQVGKPWFWTFQPPPIRLFGPITAFSAEVSVFLLALLAALFLSRRGNLAELRADLAAGWRTRRFIYVFTASLLVVAVAFLVEGFAGPSLFINRYLMPVSIATAFLTAELLRLVRWRNLLPRAFHENLLARRYLRLAAAAGLALVIAGWDFRHLPPYLIAQVDYTDKMSALLPRGVPVLCEDAFSFTELIGRQHSSGVEYTYPLDWQQTTSPDAPRVEVTQWNLMNNWRKAGYFAGSIVDLQQFLKEHSTFLVIDNEFLQDKPVPPIIGNPLALRLARTPGYTFTRYGVLQTGFLYRIIWLVRHDPKATPTPRPRSAVDYR